MALSLDEVKRIAALAHLRLSPEEEVLYAAQLSRIVEYVDQLKAREGSETGPLEFEPQRESTVLDVPRQGLSRAVVLDSAPLVDGEFVIVPRIKGLGTQR